MRPCLFQLSQIATKPTGTTATWASLGGILARKNYWLRKNSEEDDTPRFPRRKKKSSHYSTEQKGLFLSFLFSRYLPKNPNAVAAAAAAAAAAATAAVAVAAAVHCDPKGLRSIDIMQISGASLALPESQI